MTFKIGDSVLVLDEDLSGIIKKIDGNSISIETEDGFLLDFKTDELVKNKSDNDNYQKVLDGGKYDYDDYEVEFRGLADVLAYFTYARFIRKSNNVSTSHGFVTKTTTHSQPFKSR